jgi:hypothetical protein
MDLKLKPAILKLINLEIAEIESYSSLPSFVQYSELETKKLELLNMHLNTLLRYIT